MKKKNTAWDSPDVQESVKNALNAVMQKAYDEIDNALLEFNVGYQTGRTAGDLVYEALNDDPAVGLFGAETVDNVFRQLLCSVDDMARRLEDERSKAEFEVKAANERLARVKKLQAKANRLRA